MTYILPADNAVIDYSIMSQIINAINTIDSQVQAIVKNQQSSNSSGGATTSLAKTVGGSVSVEKGAKKKTISIPDIKNIQSVVGTIFISGTTTPVACTLNARSGSTATFVFAAMPAAGDLYWIAYGTN